MKVLFFVFLFLISENISAQANDECKYFEVLSYIRTNASLNNKIKEYTKNTIFGKAIKKKSKFIDFNVRPWIEFFGFREFKDKISYDSIGIDKRVVSDDKIYHLTYYFEPKKSILLEKTIEKNDSKIYLTFSKVIGNTLIVEILNFDNGQHVARRIGSGVKVLFIFDQLGFIKTTLLNTVVYN